MGMTDDTKYRDIRDLTEAERAKLLDAIRQMIQLDDEIGLFDADPADLMSIYFDQRRAARKAADADA